METSCSPEEDKLTQEGNYRIGDDVDDNVDDNVDDDVDADADAPVINERSPGTRGSKDMASAQSFESMMDDDDNMSDILPPPGPEGIVEEYYDDVAGANYSLNEKGCTATSEQGASKQGHAVKDDDTFGCSIEPRSIGGTTIHTDDEYHHHHHYGNHQDTTITENKSSIAGSSALPASTPESSQEDESQDASPSSPPPLPHKSTGATHTSGEDVPTSPMSPSNKTSYKTKIDQRLTQALDRQDDFATLRRSPDLIPLAKQYQDFRKQLRTLIATMKRYQETTQKMHLARKQLFDEYKEMATGTPLFDHVGRPLKDEQLKDIHQDTTMQGKGVVVTSRSSAGEDNGGNGSNGGSGSNGNLELPAEKMPLLIIHQQAIGTLSLVAIEQLAAMEHQMSADEFDKYILGYAKEWEEIATKRLDEELKAVWQLQRQRLHYERKVAGLRKRVNHLEGRGKDVAPTYAEKVDRNEHKLSAAWRNHEERASKLCVLLEQVMHHGWKDLYPLIKNTMRWEMNRLSRDEQSYGKLKSTLEAMRQKSFGNSPRATATTTVVTPTATATATAISPTTTPTITKRTNRPQQPHHLNMPSSPSNMSYHQTSVATPMFHDDPSEEVEVQL